MRSLRHPCRTPAKILQPRKVPTGLLPHSYGVAATCLSPTGFGLSSLALLPCAALPSPALPNPALLSTSTGGGLKLSALSALVCAACLFRPSLPRSALVQGRGRGAEPTVSYEATSSTRPRLREAKDTAHGEKKWGRTWRGRRKQSEDREARKEKREERKEREEKNEE